MEKCKTLERKLVYGIKDEIRIRKTFIFLFCLHHYHHSTMLMCKSFVFKWSQFLVSLLNLKFSWEYKDIVIYCYSHISQEKRNTIMKKNISEKFKFKTKDFILFVKFIVVTRRKGFSFLLVCFFLFQILTQLEDIKVLNNFIWVIIILEIMFM